jgi:hypothetical protein
MHEDDRDLNMEDIICGRFVAIGYTDHMNVGKRFLNV